MTRSWQTGRMGVWLVTGVQASGKSTVTEIGEVW